jgi:hypothetical protein
MRQSPLVGYNNNVKHKGQLFHIQTEDSGFSHPHVITHLFMDGGRILKSIKTSYAEHVGTEKVSDFIRTLMKDQHKGMLLRLRAGEFDSALGDATPAPAPTSVRFSELPPMPPLPKRAAAKTAEAGRYAATEPAVPFAPEVSIPKDRGRSLDEIILGYLSEDLEG